MFTEREISIEAYFQDDNINWDLMKFNYENTSL